jgi:FlgD Ig-like domain/FG-GAP-like repeat
MWIKIVCCIVVIQVSCFSFAQSRYETKEEKLEKLKSRTDIKVTEIQKDILKLEYPNGKVLYKNIADYKPTTNDLQPTSYSPTYDSTIIDLRTIDTTLYYQKYQFWQEVPIFNWDFDYLRIGDVNNNGKPELYGARKFFLSQAEPITIYELNSSNNFVPLYQYDSVYLARSIFDVDSDENEEVLLTLPPIYDTVGNQQRFFSKDNYSSFATKLNFTLTYYGHQPNVGSQLNDIVLGNFDEDQFIDLIFSTSGYSDVHIFEYNPSINNFDSVYRFDINDMPPEKGGFSVGDFDLDGKTDFVFGTISGKVYLLENDGNNQYTNSWQGSVESNNAYIHTWTHDEDKNGKPEFWVLGDAYYGGVGTTRLTIFETNGNNSYEVVGRVDLVGVFSFYAGTMQAVDINNDGVEEVAVCIDGNFLILKFNGSQNHQTYEVYYIKQNELETQGEYQVYVGATMYDLLGYDKKNYEILISMYHTVEIQPNNYETEYLTKIYIPDHIIVGNDNDKILPTRIKLYQNYPNPFNPSTNINFDLKNPETVLIKAYNILGKEIKLLLNENLPAGEHSVQWDGKDDKGNILPGGVYFIQLKAGEYRQTIKAVLLK